MTKIELQMRYKAETAFSAEPISAWGRFGKFGDLILDSYELDARIPEMIKGNSGEFIFPDPEYHKWMEEKLMELLK